MTSTRDGIRVDLDVMVDGHPIRVTAPRQVVEDALNSALGSALVSFSGEPRAVAFDPVPRAARPTRFQVFARNLTAIGKGA